MAICGFNRIVALPFFEYKVQLFELVFLGFIVYIGIKNIRLLEFDKWLKIDRALLFLLLLSVVNVLVHPESQVLLENMGTIYLIAVYYIISRVLRHSRDIQNVLRLGFGSLAVAMIVVCSFLILLYFIMDIKHGIYVYKNYPYLGNVIRLQGLSSSPGLLVSCIAFCMFMFQTAPIKKRNWLLPVLLFILAFLTLSKEFFWSCFLLLMYGFVQKFDLEKQWWPYVTIGLVSIGILFFVFFLPCQNRDCLKKSHVLGNPIKVTEKISIRPTSYFYLQKSALAQIVTHPIFGVGFGNYQKNNQAYKMAGFVPNNIPAYEPHDNFLSRVAEYGIGYLIFILLFFDGLGELYQRIKLRIDAKFAGILLFLIIYIIIEGLYLGSMHFRHYWVTLGMFAGLILNENSWKGFKVQ